MHDDDLPLCKLHTTTQIAAGLPCQNKKKIIRRRRKPRLGGSERRLYSLIDPSPAVDELATIDGAQMRGQRS